MSRSSTNGAACSHLSGVDNNMRCLIHAHADTCCACADSRSPTMGFVKSTGWKNGAQETTYLFRWGFYCNRCKDYWTGRLLEAPPGWSLDFPQRLISLMNEPPPVPTQAASSTLPAQSNSTNTLPVRFSRPIAPRSSPSSSNAPPPAVGPSRSARNTPVTIAPPAPPSISNAARNAPATAAPPPAMSKAARKRAAKRARAAQEQQPQRNQVPQFTLVSQPRSAQNNAPPNRSTTPPAPPAPATRSTWADLLLRHNASNLRQESRLTSPQQQPRTAPEVIGERDPPLMGLRHFNGSWADAAPAPAPEPAPEPEPERSGLSSRNNTTALSGFQREWWDMRYGSDTVDYRPGGFVEQLRPWATGSGEEGPEESSEDEDVDYEWETFPASPLHQQLLPTISSHAAPQAPPPLSEEMRQLAEDTSIILELIGKTDPGDNTGMDNDYKQILDDAFANISKIRTQYRVALAVKAGSVNIAQDPKPTVDDTLKVDSACIICCDEISNAVLIPCNHLVLCMTCSDKMGIKGRFTPGARTVPCPICRRIVLDRIKIFRG